MREKQALNFSQQTCSLMRVNVIGQALVKYYLQNSSVSNEGIILDIPVDFCEICEIRGDFNHSLVAVIGNDLCISSWHKEGNSVRMSAVKYLYRKCRRLSPSVSRSPASCYTADKWSRARGTPRKNRPHDTAAAWPCQIHIASSLRMQAAASDLLNNNQ